MGRPRTWNDAQLRRAVSSSTTWEEVAGKLRLAHFNPAIKRRADELGLDASHFIRVGVIDTRPYSTEVLGDALFDQHEADHPGRRLEKLRGDIVALEARRDHQIRRLRLKGFPVPQVARWAGVSAAHVVGVCQVRDEE